MLFQLTLPVWGATSNASAKTPENTISTHAPRVGSDRSGTNSNIAAFAEFQLTLPVWGATRRPARPCRGAHDFNSRSPCGERQFTGQIDFHELIFQLTLPVWGATTGRIQVLFTPDISTHAPRVGSDMKSLAPRRVRKFQLTLPVWGATIIDGEPAVRGHFNSRSPCGERPVGTMISCPNSSISTHAPRVGSDAAQLTCAQAHGKFQLTLPVWGATSKHLTVFSLKLFQLTLPVWGATPARARPTGFARFQLTLPVWGATFLDPSILSERYFNSRSPCGERLDV